MHITGLNPSLDTGVCVHLAPLEAVVVMIVYNNIGCHYCNAYA